MILLLLPSSSCADYSTLMHSFSQIDFGYAFSIMLFSSVAIILLFLCLLFSIVAAYCYPVAVTVRKENFCDHTSLQFIGLLWLVIPYLPCTHAFLNVGFVLAERTLYSSSIGYAIILGSTLVNICRKCLMLVRTAYEKYFPIFSMRVLVMLMYVYAAILSLQLVNRNSDWFTNKRLWLSEYRYCNPIISGRSLNNLAKAYQRQHDFKKAFVYFRKAITLNMYLPQPYFNIGLMYHIEMECRLAKLYYLKALEIQPDYEAARNNLKTLGQSQACESYTNK